jgi:hypothetical protein
VHIVSEPPGARVVHNGQLLADLTTPGDVLVEAGKPQRFVLTMPHKVPVVFEAFVPARGADVAKSGALVDGIAVKIESGVEAKVTVTNAPTCRDVALPVECVVAPGPHAIDFVGPGTLRATRKLEVRRDVTVRFDFGVVAAGAGKQLQINGRTVARATLEAGARDVTVVDDAGTHVARVVVKAGATVIVQ